MNRRGFLSSLFKGLVVAAATPQIVTHGLHLKKTVDVFGNTYFRRNNLWVSAPYEIWFALNEDAFKPLKIGPPPEIVEKAVAKIILPYEV